MNRKNDKPKDSQCKVCTENRKNECGRSDCGRRKTVTANVSGDLQRSAMLFGSSFTRFRKLSDE